VISTIAALSTFYNDAKDIFIRRLAQETDVPIDWEDADDCSVRLPHTLGMPYIYPDNDLSYPGNFLTCFPVERDALPANRRWSGRWRSVYPARDMNRTAPTKRAGRGSSHSGSLFRDSGAMGAYGPLHAGQRRVVRMLHEIARAEVPEFIKR